MSFIYNANNSNKSPGQVNKKLVGQQDSKGGTLSFGERNKQGTRYEVYTPEGKEPPKVQSRQQIETASAQQQKPTQTTQKTPPKQQKMAPPPSPEQDAQRRIAEMNDMMEADTKKYLDELEAHKKRADEATAGLIDSIQKSYAGRIESMKTVNQSIMGNQVKLGMRSGRQRYAGEIQTSILGAEERAGLQRIQSLEAERDSLINQAQRAADEKDFEYLSNRMSMVRDMRNQQKAAIKEQLQLSQQAEVSAMEKARFAMEQQKFSFEIEQYQAKQEQVLAEQAASAIVSGVGFGSDPSTMVAGEGEIMIATGGAPMQTRDQMIIAQAEEMGIESAVLAAAVADKEAQMQSAQWEQQKEYVDLQLKLKELEGSDFEQAQALLDFEMKQLDYQGKQVDMQISQQKFEMDRMLFGENYKSKILQNMQAEKEANGEVLTQRQQSSVTTLRTQYSQNQTVKEFQAIQGKKYDVDRILNNKDIQPGASDAVIIYNFMKAMDPSSIVRESEFDAAKGFGQNFFQEGSTYANKFTKGMLLGGNREALVSVIDEMFKSKNVDYRNTQDEYARMINLEAGINNGRDYLPEFQIDYGAVAKVNEYDSLQQLYGEGTDDEIEQMESFMASMKAQGADISEGDALNWLFENTTLDNFMVPPDQLPTTSGDKAASPFGDEPLTVTSPDGSKFWKAGVDVVLPGGKGAPVTLPYSLEVEKVIPEAESGGFGNQIQARLPSGHALYISHLDQINVKDGDYLPAGAVMATQGNTGKVYSTSGGDGTHLDLSIPRQEPPDYSNKGDNNTWYASREVMAMLGIRKV